MKIFFYVIAFILCLSCSKEDYYVKRKDIINIVEVSIPDSVDIYESINIYAKAEVHNASYKDLYIELYRIMDFKYSLKAYGTYESYGTTTDWLITTDTIIDFNPTQKGKYFVEVWTSSKSSYIDSIVVN